MVYFIILSLILIGIFFYDRKQSDLKTNGIWLYYFILLLMVLVSGFSYRLGADGPSYYHGYERFSNNIGDLFCLRFYNRFNGNMPGWVIINTLIKSLGLNFTCLKLLHALFINSVIMLFLLRFTKWKFTSSLLYFIIQYPYFNFEILKESLSVAFFLLSVPYFLKSQYKKY